MSSSPNMTQATAPTSLLHFAPIVTSQLIGSLLSFFFFGSLVIQVYVYRLCFPRDHVVLKTLVYFTFLLLLVSTCLNAADSEYWFGSGFGDISRFADPRNSRLYTPIFGASIAFVVQAFFCHKIFATKRAMWPLSVLVFLVAAAECAGGMGAGILAYRMNGSREHVRAILFHLWLIAGVVADVGILVPMCMILKQTFLHKSDLVQRVVRWTIETNLFSMVVALLGLLLYVAVPNSTYFICPVMILPGIYANTLLAVLNHRAIETDSSSGGHSHSALSSSNTGQTATRPSVGSRTPMTREAQSISFAARGRPSDEEKSGANVRARSSLDGNHWRDAEEEADTDEENELAVPRRDL
ncbi:hypothetical protein MKEN_01006200 [Mycena kentingensis (nom. inval.)]|nr:hypothetical protein MKEN_01006200 [Mycena kentingensis (nom. inval.)]